MFYTSNQKMNYKCQIIISICYMGFFSKIGCPKIGCPKAGLMYPCRCENDDHPMVQCTGHQTIDLKHTFESLSKQLTKEKKQLQQLFLTNTAITELEANTFSDITFEEIYIDGAIKLTSIDSNAFNGTNQRTKRFQVYSTPIVNSPPKYDIFKMFNSMTNLEILTFGTFIEEIPSYAFTSVNGSQNKLQFLSIHGPKLKKLSENAFYNLDSLVYLDLAESALDKITPNALRFKTNSNKTLIILMDSFLFNGSNIDVNALVNINRQVILQPFCRSNPCPIQYLDETIFANFLNANENNKIQALGSTSFSIDCNDCRSYWIRKNIKYIEKSKITGLKCTNGKEFLDKNNFSNCAN